MTSLNRHTTAAAAIVAGLLGACGQADAQERPLSVGVEAVGLALGALGEGPAGVGVRLSAGLGQSPLLLDVSATIFPENPSGNFGERLWLAGLRMRLPLPFDRFPVFVRVRAGQIHFNGTYFKLRLSDRVHAALDAGVTVEYRLARRLRARLDLGDLVIPFGGASYLREASVPDRLGTVHNRTAAIGVAFDLRYRATAGATGAPSTAARVPSSACR